MIEVRSPPEPAEGASPSCEDAFRELILVCAGALDIGLADFLETEQESGPHKARVALRRLTTALDAFDPILRHKRARALRKKAKALFRQLGEVRDSDVFTLSRARNRGHEKRLKANLALRRKVRNRLRKDRVVGFSGEITRAVMPGGELFRDTPKARVLRRAPLRDFARGLLEQAWQRVVSYGQDIHILPPERMHEFRKDMKSLRYLAEFFASHFPALGAEPFRSDFRDIQDALGILNDHAVAMRIEGREPSPRLPPRVAKAKSTAEQIWIRLSQTTPPWHDPSTV